MTAAKPALPAWPALPLAVLGSLGFAAAWVLLAAIRGSQCSWMAVFAALDAVILLRLAHAPPGWLRAVLAAASTLLAVVAANWGIAATEVGRMVGLLPWQSMAKLGPAYGWTLAMLANGPADLAWIGSGLVLALATGRGMPAVSARRPAPSAR